MAGAIGVAGPYISLRHVSSLTMGLGCLCFLPSMIPAINYTMCAHIFYIDPFIGGGSYLGPLTRNSPNIILFLVELLVRHFTYSQCCAALRAFENYYGNRLSSKESLLICV